MPRLSDKNGVINYWHCFSQFGFYRLYMCFPRKLIIDNYAKKIWFIYSFYNVLVYSHCNIWNNPSYSKYHVISFITIKRQFVNCKPIVQFIQLLSNCVTNQFWTISTIKYISVILEQHTFEDTRNITQIIYIYIYISKIISVKVFNLVIRHTHYI